MCFFTGRLCGVHIGGRAAQDLRDFLEAFPEARGALSFTDDLAAYAAVLPEGAHFTGKPLTQKLESLNANIRHHLALQLLFHFRAFSDQFGSFKRSRFLFYRIFTTRSPSGFAGKRSNVSLPCCSLMCASPERPCDDLCGLDLALRDAVGDASDFLDGPSDQRDRRALRIVFGGVEALARCRMTAVMAKASMTRETWRCQPCHERVSL